MFNRFFSLPSRSSFGEARPVRREDGNLSRIQNSPCYSLESYEEQGLAFSSSLSRNCIAGGWGEVKLALEAIKPFGQTTLIKYQYFPSYRLTGNIQHTRIW